MKWFACWKEKGRGKPQKARNGLGNLPPQRVFDRNGEVSFSNSGQVTPSTSSSSFLCEAKSDSEEELGEASDSDGDFTENSLHWVTLILMFDNQTNF